MIARQTRGHGADRHEAEADSVARRTAGRAKDEAGVRREVGDLLGFDFSVVRFRPDAEDLGADVGAETSGSEIRVAPGHFRPDHPFGRALIAHELTHVAQQGAAPPSAQLAARAASLADPTAGGLTPAPRGMRQRTISCTPGKEEAAEEAPARTPTPPPARTAEDPKKAVAAVKSLRLEEELKPGLATKKATLDMRHKQREDAIRKALEGVSEASAYGQKLQRDLKKSRQDVIDTKDEAASPGLRNDILKAQATFEAGQKSVAEEEKKFSRFDDVFAGPDVLAALEGSGFSAAELKALVSQESGDLKASAEADTEGDIRGLAQIGESAAKAVGANPADRTAPKKAIVIAAKYLALNAATLKKSLLPVPTGDELKKFVLASYNAGQWTIEETQRQAIAQKRAGSTWNEMVAVTATIEDAPLYKGWVESKKKVKGKIDPAQKYRETKEYVERIFRRLQR